MANPARDARNKAQTIWPGASVSARGRNWIRHQHPGIPNRFMLDASIGPMHIEGSDTEINTQWVPSTGAWQHEMTLADFQAHARDTFNAGNLLEFRKGSEWVIFDPQSINWVNQDNSRQQIAIKQAVVGQVNDDILSFPEGYGPGRHFRYQNHTTRLQKLITIDSLASLPAPTVTGTIWFEAEFSISTSSGVDLYLDGVRWAKANNVRVKSANRIEFRDAATGTQTLWWLDFPRAFDSAGNETVGEVEVRRQGGPASLFITIRIHKTWIDTAVFPIFIDPTIDASVATGFDDAHESADGATFSNNGIRTLHHANTVAGSRYVGGSRFANITVGQGDTIDTAYHEGYYNNTSVDSPLADLLAEDVDNSVDFNTTADVIDRARTTASVAFTGTNVGVAYYGNAIEIKTVIQEVIDRVGWASGNALTILLVGRDTSNSLGAFASYDGDATNPAKLHIEYTAAGGGRTTKNTDPYGLGIAAGISRTVKVGVGM